VCSTAEARGTNDCPRASPRASLRASPQAALDEKIRIIGRGAVKREARELKAMQGLVQRACGGDGDSARDLMGPTYAANKDCMWHDQVSYQVTRTIRGAATLLWTRTMNSRGGETHARRVLE
jgi:hypothetical protein